MPGTPEVVRRGRRIRRSRGEPAPERGRPAARPSAVGHSLLVVDAEACPRLCERLGSVGLRVTCVTRGTDGLVELGRLDPDAVLVSPVLADVPAAEVVATMRRFGSRPILLGVGAEDVAAAGPVFVAGATAAVSRPYDPQEVLERLTAELPHFSAREPLVFGPLLLDPAAHTVRLDGVELERVPLKEFELLRLLMLHADQVVSPAEIRGALWPDPGAGSTGRAAPSANAIAVHVNRLRGRLHPPVVLRTVRGLGYRLTVTGE
jgi:DNA-binding response OmpR family regulator